MMVAVKLGKKNNVGRILTYTVLCLGVVVFLFPFLWMILSSFKSNVECVLIPPTFFPAQIDLAGYERAFKRGVFIAYRNTFITSFGIVLLQLTSSAMAAYAFARLSFPGKNVLFMMILFTMMVPQNMTLVTKYKIVSALGLIDSLGGVIVANCISVSMTFFIRQSFKSFPKDLEDAAKIDGCSYVGIFTRIMLPLSTEILTATGILLLLNAWNELLWPNICISSERYRVLSMFIALCKGQYVTDYGFLMAASVLAVGPVILIYIIFQKAFIGSIVMTGIKD